MGPIGSGKSTAMNIIGCLDTPTTGSYLFHGVEVGDLDRDQRALLRRHYLGFVFQGFNLLPRTTALENVELPLIYRGMRVSGAPRARARRARPGRARRAATPHAQASSPAASSSASPSPAPSSPSPPCCSPTSRPAISTRTTSREIMNLLTGLNRERGITIVMVTHEADMAAYADRIIRFVDGRIDSDVPQRGGRLMLCETLQARRRRRSAATRCARS